MNDPRPRNTRSGCNHQTSRRAVSPNARRLRACAGTKALPPSRRELPARPSEISRADDAAYQSVAAGAVSIDRKKQRRTVSSAPREAARRAPREPAVAAAPPWRRALPALLLLALTLFAYLPVLQAGTIWDDDDYVMANALLRTPSGLARIWTEPGATPQYYPLVFSTFWIEYHLWGLEPAGYHLVNVLLHALAAILLWRALARLRIPGALFAAALFAVHPVHVESVAWITERKNVLSAVLFLASMLLFFRFRPPGEEPAPPWRGRPVLFYGLSLLA